MPVYDFCCPEHGAFEAMRPMSAYADPCACPTCGQASPRVMLGVPHVSGLSGARRRAHEVNERSADAPKRLSTHGPGPGGRPVSRKSLTRADGSRSYPSSRPWMLSH